MACKDILVFADSTDYAPVRFDTAAKLAKLHGAHLTAVHADNLPYMPADVMGTGIIAAARQWQKTVQKERAEKVRRLVDAASQRNGIDIEWRQVEGAVDDVMLSQSPYFDLLVISQAGDPLDLEQPIDPSPGTLALSSGRPVLVVPNRVASFDVGSNILVAWKPCAEAARAIHDALPLMEKAKSVTVLEVKPEAGKGERLVGAEIAHHLARHGVTVTAMSVDKSGLADGATILSRAAEIGADMIVMGAYGHSRLREVVLGGVTSHVLKSHQVPVFLSH